jgi:2-polyprenyl-6-methoxyphenol hydroxylase-like FAD-dependent oxidoreductase
MAQGVAMAVEDALVLAELVAGSNTIEAALTAYVTRRRPRVEWVQEQTRQRDRTRNLPPLVRNLSLRLGANRIYRSNYRPLLGPA